MQANGVTKRPRLLWEDSERGEILSRIEEVARCIQCQLCITGTDAPRLHFVCNISGRRHKIFQAIPEQGNLEECFHEGITKNTLLNFYNSGGSAESSKCDLTALVRTMRVIYRCILHRESILLRAFYYENKDIFSSQRSSGRCVSLVSRLLRVRRPYLGIFANPKGQVWGPISVFNGTSWLDGMCNNAHRGFQISDSLVFQKSFAIKLCQSTENIDGIIIVEKFSAMHRLVDELFGVSRFNYVVVSGGGMPSLAVREFAHELSVLLPECPIYGICDFNPCGLFVLASFVSGTPRSLDSTGWVKSLKDYSIVGKMTWLGISDIHVQREIKHRQQAGVSFSLPNLSPRDHSILETLMSDKRFSAETRNAAQRFGCFGKMEIDQVTYTSLEQLIDQSIHFEKHLLL